jgi:oxygen-independent coproporphyrinogen-3 oxidase
MAMLEEGASEEEIKAYMEETYFCSEEKIKLSTEIAKWEMDLLGQLDYKDGYSLYVGIPFCPSTCLYCSFTSYPLGKWQKRIDEYLDALCKEIDYIAEELKDKVLNTVYIGGGTPTTLNAEQMDRLLTKIEEKFDFTHVKEFTVEAGRPDSVTREKLEAIKKHKVDRISVNPQTMKDETLKIIGRHHTVQQTIEAYQLAREVGFDNINMDLIIGLPGETKDDVAHTLNELKELAPDSITVHSLAIKRAARLNLFKDTYEEMGLENSAEIMDLTYASCMEQGLLPYYLYRQKNMAGNFENVGYAKADKAGIYNILIMEEKQSIVAAGAGASTKMVYPDGRIERIENVKDVGQYIERIDEMIQRKKDFWEVNGR